jgi:O-antigen/teichoic acid export membrane protein
VTVPASPRPDSLRAGLLLSFAAQAATLVGGGVVSVILARSYGAAAYGQWAVGAVWATITGVLVEGGLSGVLLRDASRSPEAAGRAVGLVLRTRARLASVVAPLVLAAAAVQLGALAAWTLTAFLVATRLFESLQSSFQQTLQALGDYRTPTRVEVLRRLGIVAVSATVPLLGGPMWLVALGAAGCVLGSSGALYRAVHTRVRVDISATAERPRDAAWFWVSGVLYWINGEVCQLILSEVAGDAETGIFGAAYRLAVLFRIVPEVVATSLTPRLFRDAVREGGAASSLAPTGFVLSGLAALLVVEAWAVHDPLVVLLFGEPFRAAGPVFAWSALALGVLYVRSAAGWFLTTSDRLPAITAVRAIGAALNVALCLAWIPTRGAVGAAQAAVGSELVMAVVSMALAARWLPARVTLVGLAGLLVGAPAAFVHLALDRLAPGFSIPWIVAATSASIASLATLGAVTVWWRRRAH